MEVVGKLSRHFPENFSQDVEIGVGKRQKSVSDGFFRPFLDFK